MTPAPDCFDSESQWQLWMAAAQASFGSPGVHSFCADCSPEYQSQMIVARRCAHPTVSFASIAGENCRDNYKKPGAEPHATEGRRHGTIEELIEIATKELGFNPAIEKG